MKDTNWRRPVNTAWKFTGLTTTAGKICYINKESISAGYNAVSAATWGTNRALIKLIHVITTDTNWSLTLYPDSDFDENGIVKPFKVIEEASGEQVIHLDYPYVNVEDDYKLYLQFSGVGPFHLIVIGEVRK